MALAPFMGASEHRRSRPLVALTGVLAAAALITVVSYNSGAEPVALSASPVQYYGSQDRLSNSGQTVQNLQQQLRQFETQEHAQTQQLPVNSPLFSSSDATLKQSFLLVWRGAAFA